MIFLLWPLIGLVMFYITMWYLEGTIRFLSFWTDREFFFINILLGPITIFLFFKKLK